MAEFFVIRLGNEYESAEWLLVDSNGTRLSGVSSGTLAAAASDAGDRAVIVLVPATDVLTTSVQIPIRSSAKIRAALPFALEEDLAEDVETLHFAAGARRDDGRVPAAVVSREKLDSWLAELAAVGIEPVRMVPEIYGLTVIPGTMSVLVGEHGTLFNDGDATQFVMQDAKPSDLLVAAGKLDPGDEEDDTASGHLVAFCLPEHEQALEGDWIALRHELQSVDVSVLPDGSLPKLAVTVATGQGVNLLQGAYGKKTEYSGFLAPWKTAAMLLLGIVVLALASKGVDYYRLTAELSTLQQQFSSEYREIRPGDNAEIVDPGAKVESLRRGLGTAAAPAVFLPSLRSLSTAMAESGAAKIEALDYRAGIVTIRLTAPDVATLDKIQQAVGASGQFTASIQSTDQVAGAINGRIQIRESGS